MCDAIGRALEVADQQRVSRRALVGGSLVGAGATVLPTAVNAATRPSTGVHQKADVRGHRTRLVLLGTAGGPVWWPGTRRAGIASAVVVGTEVYLVDCGDSTFHQYRSAGLATSTADRELVTQLRGLFLTHLHNDHNIDYNNILQWGMTNGLQVPGVPPLQVYGPGNRGSLPALFGTAFAPPVINPENPTPGTVEMTNYLFQAYANSYNDNLRDFRQPDPRTKFAVHDIKLPDGLVRDPNVDPSPPMRPFPVYEDANVRVTATLVRHGQAFPSFGFRFDTDEGSVVFSGDTGPSQNLVRLAAGADVLVHEVIDARWVEQLFPDPSTPEAMASIDHLLTAHTTIEDVGAIAEAAGAKKLVLNHLVPGNNDHARWRRAKHGYSGKLIVGEDLMHIGVGRRRAPGRWMATSR